MATDSTQRTGYSVAAGLIHSFLPHRYPKVQSDELELQNSVCCRCYLRSLQDCQQGPSLDTSKHCM